jgi:hypothetical protein
LILINLQINIDYIIRFSAGAAETMARSIFNVLVVLAAFGCGMVVNGHYQGKRID